MSSISRISSLDISLVKSINGVISTSIGRFNSINFRYVLGDFLGGGMIIHILEPGDIGYKANNPIALICSLSDQSTDKKWNEVLISPNTYLQTGDRVGTGFLNTYNIITTHELTDSAAETCWTLNLNGYSDWFLPSIDELLKVFDNGFTGVLNMNDTYWSSTDNSETEALTYNLGSSGVDVKDNKLYVRAMRYHYLTPDLIPPSAPTLLQAGVNWNSFLEVATVNWTASTDNVGVDGYNVYRDINNSGSFTFIGSTTGSTTFTDTTITSNGIYSYKVNAFDGSFNISDFSDTRSIEVNTF